MKIFYHIASGTDFKPSQGILESKNIDTCKEEIREMYKGDPLLIKEIRKATKKDLT